jgi:hypothetical protein
MSAAGHEPLRVGGARLQHGDPVPRSWMASQEDQRQPAQAHETDQAVTSNRWRWIAGCYHAGRKASSASKEVHGARGLEASSALVVEQLAPTSWGGTSPMPRPRLGMHSVLPRAKGAWAMGPGNAVVSTFACIWEHRRMIALHGARRRHACCFIAGTVDVLAAACAPLVTLFAPCH